MTLSSSNQPLSVLTTIHDVMPETLDETIALLAECRQAGHERITLLVVPGKNWQRATLDTLRKLAVQPDIQLAGHGWHHKINSEKTLSLYHRLHSALLSADVAEHLQLDTTGVARLIQECHNWFIENGLPQPELYVPPAWAMGRISRRQLRKLPFRYYEFQSGVYDSNENRFRYLPLTGYEANNGFSASVLAFWNALNMFWAKQGARLRISLHPYDMSYRLNQDLKSHLRLATDTAFYS